MQLSALLAPRSIAILGASDRPSIGRALIESLDRMGFDGEVLPINPKYPELVGRRCYASVDELPAPPDVTSGRCFDCFALSAAAVCSPKTPPADIR